MNAATFFLFFQECQRLPVKIIAFLKIYPKFK